MKIALRCFWLLLVCSLLAVAAACGDDDGGGGGDGDGDPADAAAAADSSPPEPDAGAVPDAMPPDLACLGNPLPTDAANPVTLSGAVIGIDVASQGEPVEGAIVELRRAANDRVLDDNAPGGTPADGTYSLTGRTAGNPLVAYLHSTADEFVTTRLYPPIPVTTDVPMVPLPMFSPLVVSFLSPDQEPDNGIIVIIVLDCSGQPIPGATVSSEPAAGEVAYADDTGVPDSGATSTGAQGLAYLLNVPAGPVVVSAQSGGEDLLAHEVESVPEEVTATIVLPGPPSL
ncbi:MAG TPA: carboxypeptidase-like regulatory domain-containing protein [Kofleriaceae bacterium]|nr:carboxypeptidase-like regulatory domain-containing protein [Kofleriaceae bacterium]